MEPQNLLVNMEIDSFALSGGYAAILNKSLRMGVPDLLCVSGQGISTGPGLSRPKRSIAGRMASVFSEKGAVDELLEEGMF